MTGKFQSRKLVALTCLTALSALSIVGEWESLFLAFEHPWSEPFQMLNMLIKNQFPQLRQSHGQLETAGNSLLQRSITSGKPLMGDVVLDGVMEVCAVSLPGLEHLLIPAQSIVERVQQFQEVAEGGLQLVAKNPKLKLQVGHAVQIGFFFLLKPQRTLGRMASSLKQQSPPRKQFAPVE
jgi:hypothetical protein